MTVSLTAGKILGVQPIFVYVPVPSSPPWWATPAITVSSALVAILLTAFVARSREHYKMLWDRRADIYVKMSAAVKFANDAVTYQYDALGDEVWRQRLRERLEAAPPASELRMQATLFAAEKPKHLYSQFLSYRRYLLEALEQGDDHERLARSGGAKITAGIAIREIGKIGDDLEDEILKEVYDPPRIVARRPAFRPVRRWRQRPTSF